MVIKEGERVYIYRLNKATWQWLCVNREGDITIPCTAGFWGSQERCFDDAKVHALEKHGVRL